MLFRRSSFEHLQLNAFGYATWKSYANLRKKAVEQEFTWSGFVISLSIAFLFVFSGSTALNSLYEKTVEKSSDNDRNTQIMRLEKIPGKPLAFGSAC